MVGAAAVFSIIMKAYFAFALPALIPIIVRFFLLGDDIHRAMGGMGLLAGIIISYIAKRMNAVTVSSMKLQFENIDLIPELDAIFFHFSFTHSGYHSKFVLECWSASCHFV